MNKYLKIVLAAKIQSFIYIYIYIMLASCGWLKVNQTYIEKNQPGQNQKMNETRNE